MLGAVCCNIFQGNKFRISFLKNFFYTDICKWFMSVHPEYMSEYLCKKLVTVSRKLRWILAAAADQVSGQGLIQVKTFDIRQNISVIFKYPENVFGSFFLGREGKIRMH